jgi:4-alpha-glucanotransferase
LRLLGKQSLVLAIHDPSLPAAAGEDTGRGTPYSRGGLAFARFVRSLGFSGLQLGPQGLTSRVNPSPYDGTLFSRNPLSVDLAALARDGEWAGLLPESALASVVSANPRPEGLRVAYAHAWGAYRQALAEFEARLSARCGAADPAALALAGAVQTFRAGAGWLDCDALFEALCAEHGDIHWEQWPRSGPGALDRVLCCPPEGAGGACSARRGVLRSRHRGVIDRYVLTQFVLHRQHVRFREAVGRCGLKLYGDVQIGLSTRDAWRFQPILLRGYRLGAPPSRTNPQGQPWGLAVLDPAQYRQADGSPGPVLRFFADRMGKLLTEFDGVRIDHPHGLVCPWVYRADDPDPLHAVQHGARLFDSPDLPDHPALARYAIARRDQLAPGFAVPRHADDWVRDLEPEQVGRYAVLCDALVEQVRGKGCRVEDIVCEVLSTRPFPLGRVIARYGLGRFRVTQKARLDDPGDVYRSENARPEDWVMVGNHDTPPVWRLVREWQASGEARRQAEYLAGRLRPEGGADALAGALAADPLALAHAKVADLFVSRARHVMVFFPDLLGLEDVYNRPGTVSEDNWTLRVPPDYATRYPADARAGRALSLPRVLAMALEARGGDLARAQAPLIARLRQP